MRPAEEGVLAGQATDQAGQLRVTGEELVPQAAVAVLGNAVQAVAAPVVQGGAQCRLAGGNAQ